MPSVCRHGPPTDPKRNDQPDHEEDVMDMSRPARRVHLLAAFADTLFTQPLPHRSPRDA
ncbi:hypothetical protein CU044_3336 [Streptomyces sp. L-9-10]|nr:hypothetical protein CU044_3336 [Streptomyces sp. L-9-10]